MDATTRHAGYQASQRVRKRVEEIFGWVKTVAEGRKLRYRGTARNRLWWEFTAAAYKLLRMARIASKSKPPTRARAGPTARNGYNMTWRSTG
jgi:hypothetical protein